MSTDEPLADRDGTAAPSGAEAPARSAAVSAGAGSEPAEEGAEPAERPFHHVLREAALLLAVCVVVLALVGLFVARPMTVPSGSMDNTLRPGDRLLVNELAYRFGGHVQRGDVVVFDGTGSFLPYADEPSAAHRLLAGLGLAGDGSAYVKRVIGIGGDRVTCCGSDGRIRVNGVPLDESAYLYPGDTPSQVAFDVVVPAGKLWVMGDHRSDSRDSRDHIGEPGGGFVPDGKVIGRVQWVVFPVGRWSSPDRPAVFAAVNTARGTGGSGERPR